MTCEPSASALVFTKLCCIVSLVKLVTRKLSNLASDTGASSYGLDARPTPVKPEIVLSCQVPNTVPFTSSVI